MDSAEGDRQALADLFLSSGGQCWRNNQNWCTQASLKSWYGVTTDKDGRVVRLQLSANNLQGIIPVTIGFLSKLSDLELSKNQLEGPLPFSIGNMTALKYLRLADNFISGEFPESLRELESLECLYLGQTHLTGGFENVCFLKKLWQLDIDEYFWENFDLPRSLRGNKSNLSAKLTYIREMLLAETLTK